MNEKRWLYHHNRHQDDNNCSHIVYVAADELPEPEPKCQSHGPIIVNRRHTIVDGIRTRKYRSTL
jgi:hypothetical protein